MTPDPAMRRAMAELERQARGDEMPYIGPDDPLAPGVLVIDGTIDLAALVAAVLGAREAELDALRKVAELARPLAGWKLSNDGETWTNRHSLELALAEYDTICGREPRMSEPPPAPFTSAERDMLNYLTKEDAMNPPGDL